MTLQVLPHLVACALWSGENRLVAQVSLDVLRKTDRGRVALRAILVERLTDLIATENEVLDRYLEKSLGKMHEYPQPEFDTYVWESQPRSWMRTIK